MADIQYTLVRDSSAELDEANTLILQKCPMSITRFIVTKTQPGVRCALIVADAENMNNILIFFQVEFCPLEHRFKDAAGSDSIPFTDEKLLIIFPQN